MLHKDASKLSDDTTKCVTPKALPPTRAYDQTEEEVGNPCPGWFRRRPNLLKEIETHGPVRRLYW